MLKGWSILPRAFPFSRLLDTTHGEKHLRPRRQLRLKRHVFINTKAYRVPPNLSKRFPQLDTRDLPQTAINSSNIICPLRPPYHGGSPCWMHTSIRQGPASSRLSTKRPNASENYKLSGWQNRSITLNYMHETISRRRKHKKKNHANIYTLSGHNLWVGTFQTPPVRPRLLPPPERRFFLHLTRVLRKSHGYPWANTTQHSVRRRPSKTPAGRQTHPLASTPRQQPFSIAT